ncbi:MAG: thioredoxin domain-containing protein [Cytophagaceae bacterium]
MTYKDTKHVSTPNKANRLINESSPYLLQHAYNPVEWHPWGEEALEKAKAEDKPILVSIGYSACHWCHVMERECFENEEIAELMNENFINIKVDREERPDIDQIYMDALQAMNVRGGWPLNVFLTPDAKPFYGGTYFPPAHWRHLLKQISKAYKDNRTDLENSATEFTKTLNQSEIQKYGLTDTTETFEKQDLEFIFEKLEKTFDRKCGGTNKAPKFPMPSIYSFLLKYNKITNNEAAIKHVKLTLDKMAYGGIYDQIGGGFARYSTDNEWFAPHFEKMLYDNGQLLSLYAEAYQATKDEYYKQIAEETIEWLKREMLSPEGAFYSALDADSEGEEGKYYVWTSDELKQILKDDYELFKDYYNVKNRGNWEQENNILFKSLSDKAFANKNHLTMEEVKAKVDGWKKNLLSIRYERTNPGLDDKILTSWNAICLKGLIDCYRSFGKEELMELILKNAHFIREKMQINQKLYHNYKDGKMSVDGNLEDYAFVIQAYFYLYQASFDEQWLVESKKLMDYCLQNFYDPVEDMFYYTDINAEKLIARKKEIFDNVVPASNSVMATNLYFLGLMLENDAYIQHSRKMLSRVKKMLYADPAYLSNWANLYTMQCHPTAEIAIVGKDYIKLRKELNKHYLPNAIVVACEENSDLALLRDRMAINGKTTIYVCYNKTCQLPVHSIEEALVQINNAH